MSKSNASAKNRRAFGGNPPAPNPPVQNIQPQQGLTLQQVISVIDNRLLNLEVFMKETKENSEKNPQQYDSAQQYNNEIGTTMNDNSVTDVLNEFNNRFELLAQELGDLKDIVLKLQSFTMDVNKTLLEERIRVFSDLEAPGASLDNQVFELSSTTMNNDNVDSVDLKNLVKEEFSQTS